MPIEALFATRPCLRTICSRGCRAKPGRKLDLNPFNGTDSLPFATLPCNRTICSRGCRAKPGRKLDLNPFNGTDSLPFATLPCNRSASVDGPRAKVPIDVLFATRGWLRTTCSRECRAEPGREPDQNYANGTDFLPFGTRPCPKSASV